jgi:outer membrane protein assembly factor BamB
MKIAKNKKATLIALFLVLTIAVTLVALPTANAHTPPWTVPTWCYVGVTPVTVGVNQPVLIVFWINVLPPTANGAYGDRWHFTVNVTRPDGVIETLGPFTSDPVGGTYCSYTPVQVGAYTIVSYHPAEVITGLPRNPSGFFYGPDTLNDTYAASTSEPVTLTVVQQQMAPYSETPLPSGYWVRPIYGANRAWSAVAANWLGGAAQQDGPTTNLGYGLGPESSHILWAKPYWSGGIMDERTGSYGFYTGLSYESFSAPIFILDGKIYYSVRAPPRYGYYCVDLYTGETLYFCNSTGPVTGVGGPIVGYYNGVPDPDGCQSGSITSGIPAFGQIYNYESPNQHGGIPYLWVTDTGKTNTWDMLDAFTGNYICSINNTQLATGTAVYGKEGSILRYNIVNLGTTATPNYYLRVWNTSRAIWYWTLDKGGNAYWMWRPNLNMTFDGQNGFSLNASIPSVQGTIRAVREDQYVIGGTSGRNDGTTVVQGNLWALNLKPDSNGIITPTLLWNITFTPPSSMPGNTTISMGTVDPEDGVFLFSCTQTRKWYGYSLATGQLLWTSPSLEQWNYYGMSNSIYQGKLLAYGYGGILHAFDITTGNELWNWSAPYYGLDETPYPYTPLSLGCICDGKLYMYSSEHSPTMPLRRDAHIWCLNATDGTLIWQETCWANGPKIADGRLVVLDSFDNMVYCYGKGPSATTVAASPEISVHGNSIMITGTVTDDTDSGRLNTNGDLDFTLKGTPAISDESMDAWMEYMFHQRPIPTNATGVEVTLDTIDPNGNYVHIGTVTSDINGNYGYAFTPDVPGTYQIIATFAGSAAYGASSATTYLSVGEAPPATAPPEYPQPIDNTWTILGVGIAIIVVVILAAIWIKRK